MPHLVIRQAQTIIAAHVKLRVKARKEKAREESQNTQSRKLRDLQTRFRHLVYGYSAFLNVGTLV